MIDRLRRVSPDFRRVLFATLFFGATAGIFNSTLNNYLSEVHGFGAGERGWLEAGLGPRTLRTETAGVVAATLVLHAWGDLGR